MTTGLLLINLGTPSAATRRAVKRYLQEFLADPRVITLPSLLRYLLLYGIILPLRCSRSARAYQAIWTQEGSPLLVHGRALAEKLQTELGSDYQVALGMRYGNPSLKDAMMQLKDCDPLIILPLYPQYSSATTGSCLEKVFHLLGQQQAIPSLQVIREFYQHPGFIIPQTEQIRPYINTHEHLLFSFHGLPKNQLKLSPCQGQCTAACPVPLGENRDCYRAQCFATSEAIAQRLELDASQYTVAFQSRLGQAEWLKPYLDETLPQLAKKGIKRLAISCPSFVADCLETLEEIGLRANQQWQALGGEQLSLIPAVNAEDAWIRGILKIIHAHSSTVSIEGHSDNISTLRKS